MALVALARRGKSIAHHLTGRHVLASRNLDHARKILGTSVFSTDCQSKKDKVITASPPKEDLLGISAFKLFRSSCYREKLDYLKENFSSKMEEAKLWRAALIINLRLLGKVVCGSSLSSRERMLLIQTTSDMFMIVPSATPVLLYVLDFVFPLPLKLFPNILASSVIRKMKEQEATKSRERRQHTREEYIWPVYVVALFAILVMEFLLPKMVPSTFGDKIKEQETMKRILKAKIEHVKFLQDTTAEMVKQILSSQSEDIKQTAEELDEFMDNKANKAAHETNDKQVPSGLMDSVNNMLQSLEKQLDDVDSKIGNNWRELHDRDYDGRFSEEVKDAALYLEDTWDKGEIQELVKDLSKDKVYDLRLNCCFSIKKSERKIQINNLSIHGMWEGNIVNGKVVHKVNTKKEIKQNMPIAKNLLKQLTMDYPDIRSKMDTHWTCTDPKRNSENLWLHEICKHSSMDYTYWIRVIEVASPFFYEDGRCKLMDVIKEEGYISGKFKCKNFQADISRRVGKSILTTYEKKIDEKIYFIEIGILFDDSYNMLDYPKTEFKFEEFVMEQHEPEDSFIIRIWKLLKNIKNVYGKQHPVETTTQGDDI